MTEAERSLPAVIGDSGNHTARLDRSWMAVEAFLRSGDTELASLAFSRIGGFARPLAEDIATGSVGAAAAAQLLVGLARIGDAAFEQWMHEPERPISLAEEGLERTTTLGLRRSLCDPDPAIFEAAALLVHAVERHDAGDHAAAEEAFRKADSPVVRAYTDRGWGKGAAAQYGFLQLPDAPPYLPKELRPKPRMPTAAVCAEVVTRDGHHCRFCGVPVVSAAVRERVRAAYPDAVGWGKTNASQHAAF